MEKKCFESVRILKNQVSGKFYAKAVTCGLLVCDHCREQIKATLVTKILRAVNLYDLNQFFTLTTDKSYDDLVADFECLRKKLHSIKKSNYIKKSRGSTYKEREAKYYAKVDQMVCYEIKTMFYVAFLEEEAVSIAKKEGVEYRFLNTVRNKTKYKSKVDFIRQHYELIVDRIITRVDDFKRGSLMKFTPVIKDEPRVFTTYEELYKYCWAKITKNDDQDFYFIRILEIAGKPHFHILCNRYINHYLMSEMFSGVEKRSRREIEVSQKIYLNLDLQEFSDFTTEIQAQKAVTQYVTLYVTKELADSVNKFKESYPGKKRIDIVKSNKSIDTALNTKFVEDEDEEKEKYIYIETYENKKPRCSWEEIEGSNGYDGNKKYIELLKDIKDYIKNPYSIYIEQNYKDYQNKIIQLGKEYKVKKEKAKAEEKPKLLQMFKDKKYDLKNIFRQEKNRIETACLKDALESKLGEGSISIKVYDQYLIELELNLRNRADFSLEEKRDYLNVQRNFVRDIEDPEKKIVFLLGSAGSGKTQTIANICNNFVQQYKMEFCAFSAKAADVLSRKGLKAKTIHRLCRARFSEITYFLADKNNTLDVDILFIDEISMVTKYDFALLLNALKPTTKIICCGDSNQINPVGSNNLIYELELIKNKAVSFNHLHLNFRSSEGVAIIANQVLHNDFSGLEFKSFNIGDIHKKIECGYKVLTNSTHLMELINKYESQFHTEIMDTSFYTYSPGQDIMILRNDPKNDVYNGNICKIKGVIEREVIQEKKEISEVEYEREPTLSEFFSGVETTVKEKHQVVKKRTDVKMVRKLCIEKPSGETFEYSLVKSANYFQPAFAFTIHKSQGSEFPKVLIVFENKEKLLNNNLLYTAITRAKSSFDIYVTDGVNIEALKIKQENEDKYTLLDIV
ncbi:ATP-dependent RecD-like DNA helicase [Desulfosporosinus acididurans]|uniref:ATP-dependent RecD-like DNA helicase n=1 Tax=Desulfosporosinus acididurans TaxID=476652 RepID=A0A0J1FKF3_9FIRM|nr:AAA family ATPase [Desulfosporosinus acididurans]KLU63892.1 ATP-dependent RecD-like DNA helicase [Desulfosporosinus acididurans]